jgi:quinol monooxygenase YgiN
MGAGRKEQRTHQDKKPGNGIHSQTTPEPTRSGKPGLSVSIPGNSAGGNTQAPLGFRFAAPFCMLRPMSLLVVHVHVRVKPESVEAFVAATVENSRQSLLEPGIARFDVVQQIDDPTRFVLVEAYRTPEAPALHKETAHYAAWRDAVAPMMAEPRTSVKFLNVAPTDTAW